MSNSDKTQRDFLEIQEFFPNLKLLKKTDGFPVIQGNLAFSANYLEKATIKDNFDLEIILKNYPDSPPIVKEVGDKIPNDIEFHKLKDNSLCLGAPLEVKMVFAKNRSLRGFIDTLVIPFLYFFCYRKKYKGIPYGERSHGSKGILESYKEIFKTASVLDALKLLKVIAEKNEGGIHGCPCESKKKFKECHGLLLKGISSYQRQTEFLSQYIDCLDHLNIREQYIPSFLISKNLLKSAKKIDSKYEIKGGKSLTERLQEIIKNQKTNRHNLHKLSC